MGRAIENARDVARDFLHIQGPYFDADKFLEKLGFKLYWSDWTDHRMYLTAQDLVKCLNSLGLDHQ